MVYEESQNQTLESGPQANNPPFFIIFLTNNICKTAKNEATLHLNFETFLLTF